MTTSIKYSSLPQFSNVCSEKHPGNAAGRLRQMLKRLDPRQDGVFTKAEARVMYPKMNWNALVARYTRFMNAFTAWKTNCARKRNRGVCNCNPKTIPQSTKLARAVIGAPKNLTSAIDKLFLKRIASRRRTMFDCGASLYGFGSTYAYFPAPLSGGGELFNLTFSRLNPISAYKVKRIRGNTVRITINHYSGKTTILKGNIYRPHSFRFIKNPTKVVPKKGVIMS